MAEVNDIHNLLEFTAAIDTDYGLIKFIEGKYGRETEHFNISYPNDPALKVMLVHRSFKNPLTLILKDEYLRSAPDLYDEFFEKYEEEIYELSPPTDVLRFIVLAMSNPDWKAYCTVNCTSDIQMKIAKQFGKAFNIEKDFYDMKEYASLYISDVDNISKYKNLYAKYIHILSTGYNYNLDGTMRAHVIPYADFNKIRTIDPYRNIPLPLLTKEV